MTTDVLMDCPQGCVTFGDMDILFSQEEWGLLDEAQRCLSLDVMLENLSLTASLVCRHTMENEETPEQRVSVEALLHVGPSIQKTHPCEKCVPVLKDILYLADLPGHKPYFVGACANLH